MAAAAFGDMSNETPLMFSRSSSLGSLSSLEQQVALEDRGSVVSDFSRQTSGAISPSDLPDSPSQSMPPSPRRFSRRPAFRLPPCIKPLPQPVGGVFQDLSKSFAEEGTPCGISQATSLSSLTVDEDSISKASGNDVCVQRSSLSGPFRCVGMAEGYEVFADTKRRYAQEGTPRGYSRAESLSSLTADSSCLPSGIGADWDDGFEARLKPPDSFTNIGGERRWISERPAKQNAHKHVSFNESCLMRTSHEDAAVPYFADDCVKVYCTEGTPSMLSHATSLTDLSGGKAWGAPRRQSDDASTEHSLPAENNKGQLRNGQDDVKPPNRHKHVSFNDDCLLSSPHNTSSPSFEEDCIRVYCTEDTPSVLSHSASLTDLSLPNGSWGSVEETVVVQPKCNQAQLLDDGSDDDKDVLAQCIQLGWQVSKVGSLEPVSWGGGAEMSKTKLSATLSVVEPDSNGESSHSVRLEDSKRLPLDVNGLPLRFKGISGVQSWSSGDLTTKGSPQPIRHWKSNSLGDVNSATQHSKSGVACEKQSVKDVGSSSLEDFKPARPLEKTETRGDRRFCDESSDEEDAKLLQEVVGLGRALVFKQDPLVTSFTMSNAISTPSKVCSDVETSSSLLLLSSIPTLPESSLKRIECEPTIANDISPPLSEGQGEEPASSSQVHAVSENGKDRRCLESSDEEEDRRILQEVVSLGRVMAWKQHRDVVSSLAPPTVETPDTECVPEQDGATLLTNAAGNGYESSTQADFGAATASSVNEPLKILSPVTKQSKLESSHSDDEDDLKLLEQVVRLGLPSVQNFSLKLPGAHLQPRVTPKPREDTVDLSPCAKSSISEVISSAPHNLNSLAVPKETIDVPKAEKEFEIPLEPPLDSSERMVQIRLKLPAGRSLTRRFLATCELGVLLAFLDALGFPLERFKILKNWRRQELSTMNPKQTLEQLKLYPKKTLTIKER